MTVNSPSFHRDAFFSVFHDPFQLSCDFSVMTKREKTLRDRPFPLFLGGGGGGVILKKQRKRKKIARLTYVLTMTRKSDK